MVTGTYRFVFTLPYFYMCFFWIRKLEQSKLAMLQYKEDKKLRAEVKLSKTRDRTLKLESNESRNTKRGIEIHQTQITIANYDSLFAKRSA